MLKIKIHWNAEKKFPLKPSILLLVSNRCVFGQLFLVCRFSLYHTDWETLKLRNIYKEKCCNLCVLGWRYIEMLRHWRLGKYPGEVSLCAFLGLFQWPVLSGGFRGPLACFGKTVLSYTLLRDRAKYPPLCLSTKGYGCCCDSTECENSQIAFLSFLWYSSTQATCQ